MTDKKFHALVESPAWYQALTLRERANLLHAQGNNRRSRLNAEQAERRIQRWRTQKPLSQDKYFIQRLAQDNLTEEEFRRMMGEPIEDVQARIDIPPTWLTDFIQAYTERPSSASVDTTITFSEQQREISPLLVTIEPLLHQGYTRLHEGINALIQSYTNLPFDPDTIHEVLSAHLPKLLLQIAGRTLVLEVNVARLQGQLLGDTPQARFQSFVERLRQPEHLMAFFQEYPVLARVLTQCVDHWVATSLEFLQRLCADWESIQATFGVEAPGHLTEIDASGDTHREGRAVIVATFSSNFRVVYKPRSMAVDQHFQELLTWVNERSKQAGTGPISASEQELFCTLRILDRGEYGWMEYVAMAPCTTPEQVQRFYYRQGSYLALLYGIAATDFHAENLIAAGENPVLVDLETLFHPTIGNDHQGDVEADVLAAEHMGSSVLGVGLLPQLLWGSKDAEGFEFSGIGGQGGQLSPLAVPKLDGVGTDVMQVVHQRVELKGARNRPTLNGAEVNTSEYTNEIVLGFTDMYQLLLDHREDVLSASGPILRFAHDEIRVILRPTMTYALLMRGSFHPDVLRSALDRDRFFDKLWEQVEAQPYLTQSIAAEHKSLCRGDIPMFTSRPDSVDLWSDIGEHIPHFVKEPGLVSAQQRLSELSADDLTWQQWYIRASMTALTMVSDRTNQHTYHLSDSQPPATRTQLLAAARALGDGLERLAWRGTDSASWIGMVEGKGQSSVLVRLGTDLYYGTPGIALFLAHLGKVANEARYTDLARAAATTMRRQIARREFNDAAIGAFEGWGGVIYALTHLSMLWDDPTLLAEANDLLDLLPPLIEQDSAFDFMIGSAGCIASLLAFYRCTESKKALDLAIQCGERLIAGAVPQANGVGWMSPIESTQPLTGLSHGAAGIAWSLLELAALTGQARFRDTALAGIAYERSQFSPKVDNWPDFRAILVRNQPEDERKHYFSHFWCHGSAGIGLSRLISLHHLNDDQTHEEIRTAIEQTTHHGFGATHCLCRGFWEPGAVIAGRLSAE
ncbi:MAG TPA: type 2 lanthipeptide synthetase LanM family protein [Herpetosiphonaceae bacterium]